MRRSFAILILSLTVAAPAVLASPFREVKPQDELYRRVQALERYGLLDAGDRALLDRQEPVTRLQLAVMTEKAEALLAARSTGSVGSGLAAVQDDNAADPDQPPPEKPALSSRIPPKTPAALRAEIEALLKLLDEESLYLRTRLDGLATRLDDHEKKAAQFKNDLITTEGTLRRANRQGGAVKLESNAEWRFEDLYFRSAAPADVPPVAAGGVTATGRLPSRHLTGWRQSFYLGVKADVGGRGTLSTGLNGITTSSPNASQSVSFSTNQPRLDLNFDTRAGQMKLFFLKEAYIPETTLGDFTRAPNDLSRRYERPFAIKRYSDDKSAKIWEDYIHNLGFVESRRQTGVNPQSTDYRVFDGALLEAQEMPVVGDKTHLQALVGRLRSWDYFEYSAKVYRPWLSGDRVTTALSGIWVDQSTGLQAVSPDVDMRCYTAEMSFDLDPVFLRLEGSRSRFWTGYYDGNGDGNDDPEAAPTLHGDAGQATVSLYPFNFIFNNISPDYSNFMSRVDNTSVNYDQMGLDGKYVGAGQLPDSYGEVGEADTMQTNRRGWRVNLGWDGRRDAWMKDALPKFLDSVVENLDIAQRTEYRAATNNSGHYVLDVWNLATLYWPEGEGYWGDLYGGWNSPVDVRMQTIRNMLAARPLLPMSDTEDEEVVRHQYCFTHEFIPLVDPDTLEKLSHRKTYHYLALTNKWQLNRFLGWEKPLYLGTYYAKTTVSGKAQEEGQADIAKMFEQGMWDIALMAGRVLPNVNLMAHVARETWKSDSSYPRVDSKVDQTGAGVSYDIPWGSAKLETRYERTKFRSVYVPANDYDADQVYAYLNLVF